VRTYSRNRAVMRAWDNTQERVGDVYIDWWIRGLYQAIIQCFRYVYFTQNLMKCLYLCFLVIDCYWQCLFAFSNKHVVCCTQLLL
jgi:hypothetical protein